MTFQSGGRRKPVRVSLAVAHRTDHLLELTGKLIAPTGVPRAQACSGRVVIAIRHGSKTVGSHRMRVTRGCTYSSAFTVSGGIVTASARFLGDKVLTPASSKVLTINLGRRPPRWGR